MIYCAIYPTVWGRRDMFLRVTGLIVLLLAPAAATYLYGYPDIARDVALGTALASHLGVLPAP